MTTVKELLEQNDFYDYAIVRHGFTDYMRDYEIIVHFGFHSGNALEKYQFVGCIEATYSSALSPRVLAQSLADENVLAGPGTVKGDLPEGYIWGVRYAAVDPGWRYVENGERAMQWSKLMGRKMHEIDINTNVFNLKLVFADIRVALLGHEPEYKLQEDYPLPIEEATSDGGIR